MQTYRFARNIAYIVHIAPQAYRICRKADHITVLHYCNIRHTKYSPSEIVTLDYIIQKSISCSKISFIFVLINSTLGEV